MFIRHSNKKRDFCARVGILILRGLLRARVSKFLFPFLFWEIMIQFPRFVPGKTVMQSYNPAHGQAFGGCCRWVLDAVRQTVEWPSATRVRVPRPPRVTRQSCLFLTEPVTALFLQMTDGVSNPTFEAPPRGGVFAGLLKKGRALSARLKARKGRSRRI